MSKIAFDAVRNFENVIAEYAGSKYGVAVDSCTNAIFLALQYCNVKGKDVTIPSKTYPSVPCSIIHAGGKVKFVDMVWEGVYQLYPFPIIDGAKRFTKGMYEKGMFHCLSFHARKHLPIGRGGMILTDDEEAYKWFKRARFDGRNECNLNDDYFDQLGWNFYMTPEQASRGLLLFSMMKENNDDLIENQDYPDLSKYDIYKRQQSGIGTLHQCHQLKTDPNTTKTPAGADSLDCIVRLVELAHREHYNCEGDPWYGCPKSRDGCNNDAAGDECNCGADEYNAEVDRLAAILLSNNRIYHE